MRGGLGDDAIPSLLTEKNELCPMESTIPGRPLISCDDPAAVDEFLDAELSTVRLKRVYSILFLASRRNNISPLHHQQVKGRKVYITERADLHLTWYYERVFIKPIPKCLFSSAFWDKYLVRTRDREAGGDSFRAEADGFLRTYARLIIHESDMDLAKSLGLLPDTVTWDGWCNYIQPFKYLRDREVAERYHFGEIRLTRLNFWHTLRYGRSFFEVHHNYATFFARFGAPYIFIFGAITVVLTALQTALATFPQWGAYQDLASSIVPMTLVLTIVGVGFLPTLFFFFQLKELILFLIAYQHLS